VEEPKGLEEKILMGDAENAIRRRLFMTGDYNPEMSKVTRLTKKVMEKILDKYGNYNLVRHYAAGESLMPLVNDIVNGVIKLGK